MSEEAEQLRDALLSPAEAVAIDAHGAHDAAVLIAMYGHPERPGLVLTERRADMRRHAGEISFPGGRPDWPGEPLLEVALREAHEEVALDPGHVEVVGALPPTSTVVTNYKVHPFVGLIPPGLRLRPEPGEVAAVLELDVAALVRGYARRRLVRRGVPFRTPTYVVDGHLIWGATARILQTFFERVGPLVGAGSPGR